MEKLTLYDLMERRLKLLYMAYEHEDDIIAYEEIQEALNVIDSVLGELYIRYSSREDSFENEEVLERLRLIELTLC